MGRGIVTRAAIAQKARDRAAHFQPSDYEPLSYPESIGSAEVLGAPAEPREGAVVPAASPVGALGGAAGSGAGMGAGLGAPADAAPPSGVGPPLPPQAPDGYQEKLIKLIPGEIVAVYLATNGIIHSAGRENPHTTLAWGVFAFLILATPLYLVRVAKVPLANTGQLLLSTLAFIVWVYAMPSNPFSSFSWYEPLHGALALTLYTFAVPIFTGDRG